ncbi:MAG: POTRA domain-containing protein, partial [FCB group bacterium]
MSFYKNKFHLLFDIFFLIFIYHTFSLNAFGQYSVKSKYFPSPADKNQVEIDDIKFIGNKAFNDDNLKNILLSKPTSRSWPHQILEYYYNQIKSSPRLERIPPRMFTNTLNNGIKTMLNELQFYDQSKAEADVQIIQEFYNQNGFHDAVASFDFEPDSARGINLLTFTINEDSLYKIKTIIYQGLDSLPEFLTILIDDSKKVKPGDGFNENNIKYDVSTIQTLLLNNGYYYARLDIPVITKDTISYE